MSQSKMSFRLALLLVIVATIGCDRVTKHVATETLSGRPTQSYLSDTVRVGYTANAGGFLSVGDNLPLVLEPQCSRSALASSWSR